MTLVKILASLTSPSWAFVPTVVVLIWNLVLSLALNHVRPSGLPTHTKSSPWTRHRISCDVCWNIQGLNLPTSNPQSFMRLLTSSCQLADASLAPYKLASSYPTVFRGVSSPSSASSGSSTQRSIFAGASKKALDTSAIRMLLPLLAPAVQPFFSFSRRH